MLDTRSLYLVRHAIAEPRGEAWPDDDRRPLSEEGRVRMRRAVRGLGALHEPIGLVLTSPLIRAIETAEILRKGLMIGQPLVQVPALAPGGRPADVATAIQDLSDDEGVALVGHEPDMGGLAAWLLGSQGAIPFKKGAVCRIDVEAFPPDGYGRLQWFLSPRVLRRL